MRFSGTLYASMMRTAENCWFLSDCKYAKAYRSLNARDKQIVKAILSILMRYNNAASQMWNLSPRIGVLHSSQEVMEGVITFCDDHEKSALCSVFVGPSNLPPPRSIMTPYAVLGSRTSLDEANPLWEVLLYPLFQPHGRTLRTWREGLMPISTAHGSRPRKSLLLLDYVRSVMINEPHFWSMTRLAHQFVLDGWCRNEQLQAQVWRSDVVQRKIRDALRRMTAQEVPKDKIFMPPTVPGSVRYQQRFVHDAMYITSVYGNPHIFLTMTANPWWPEIVQTLPPGQTSADRPDIVCRVFNQKRKQLLSLLKQKGFLFEGHLGVQFVVSATEFQLCGLPHWHAAIRLLIDESKVSMSTVQDQLNLMDRVISARLPPAGTRDYDLVTTYMLHQAPCDERCSRKRKDGTYGCRFYFPKEESDVPRMDRKGFPIYRRGPNDSLVVPHIIVLLREMDCHLDAEWTFGSRSIGYLYKYFSKYADSTGIKISGEGGDEIAAFKCARILTCSEAVYRTFRYAINLRDPAVVLCRFSTPRRSEEIPTDDEVAAAEEFLSGNPEPLAPNAVLDAENPETDDRDLFGDLQDYFDRPVQCEDMKFTDFFASFYKLREGFSPGFGMRQRMFPDLRNRYWVRRDCSRVLARMPLVPLYAGEAYYLRSILLNEVARCYADLYGSHATFREKAEACGYVQSPTQNINALMEAIQERVTSYDFRRMYVVMAFFCGEMFGTWQRREIREHLYHDFLPEGRSNQDWSEDVTMSLCAMHMRIIASQMGRHLELDECGIPCPPKDPDELCALLAVAPAHGDLIREYANLEGCDLQRLRVVRDYMGEVRRHLERFTSTGDLELGAYVHSLRPEQYEIFLTVVDALESSEGSKCFHIDAPAGCGKPFLCQAILLWARHKQLIALPCATTGIAALHFEGGTTAHSMFKLPLSSSDDVLEGPDFDSLLMSVLNSEATKSSTRTSSRIELLRATSIILWDEACMAHKRLFEALDRLLRKIMSKPNDLFGGKLVITLGDWRQVCPVDTDHHLIRRRFSEDRHAFATSAYHTTLLSSYLWRSFTVVNLTENVRQQSDPHFHHTLLQIGNGTLGPKISIDCLGAPTTTNFDVALSWLFETPPVDIPSFVPYDPEFASKRAYICPFNADVDTVNEWVSSRLCSMWCVKARKILATDSEVRDDDDSETRGPVPMPSQSQGDRTLDTHIRRNEENLLSVEVAQNENLDAEVNDEGTDEGLHSFAAVGNGLQSAMNAEVFAPEILKRCYFDGVPQAELELVPGMVVILLRNIDPSRGLMNGVRLAVVTVRRFFVIVRHIGEAKEHVIPRIKFDVKVGIDKLHFTRLQVPLRLGYACTIHKAQAATLDRAVIDLRQGVFDHGQLYVALSRVRYSKDILVLINNGQEYVINIVHELLLQMGRCR